MQTRYVFGLDLYNQEVFLIQGLNFRFDPRSGAALLTVELERVNRIYWDA